MGEQLVRIAKMVPELTKTVRNNPLLERLFNCPLVVLLTLCPKICSLVTLFTTSPIDSNKNVSKPWFLR
jgi:hypothetical protein